ncbi:MAG: tRNA uridine-5-carboxymethylaminomethyl(34) synthesis GTPase MnmE [Gammaproteobacteria bacterium]|nr:tRNA uridine-5-carboxymethylaminomethyl(34) synthesis GTPase MnmE [Gammaproteobacteria bacterium]
MSDQQTETIVAAVTPPGRAGVAIVRVSGPATLAIAEAILRQSLTPRHAHHLPFYDSDNTVMDEGIALLFRAPKSFTGEDILELQGHGAPVVVDRLIRRAVELGARLARAGEFSQRAFLNDKMDLAQAEAVADLIAASSEEAARSAIRSLQGEFSAKIDQLLEKLIALRCYIEAAIDFPEEEIDFLTDEKILAGFDTVIAMLDKIEGAAQQGCLLNEGMTIVIAGAPNVGKSSLLNCLSKRPTAIVTDIAGTTRDLLREQINIDGLPLHIIDTAGLRDSADIVEQQGIQLARKAIDEADRILWLIDSNQPRADIDFSHFPHHEAVTIIYNKIDLNNQSPRLIDKGEHDVSEIHISVKQQLGIDLVKSHLKSCAGFHGGEGTFIARRRHLEALRRTRHAVVQGREQLEQARAGELAAEELRLAQQALAEITGQFSSDDLLGEIFSSFCIGK